MLLIDTHAHLTDACYGGADDLIAAMKTDGLDKIITVGYDLASSRAGLAIAAAHRDVYCAVGVHPSNAQALEADIFDALLSLTQAEKAVAVGEIGLDYHYDDTDRDKQLRWLNRQLDVVAACGLPVCFHVRDAYEDTQRALDARGADIRGGAVMHCFSGSKETALHYADRGYYISFAGAVTFKNANKFPEIIRALPLDRILVETDAPYLSPHPFRGETNYPKRVALTAQKIAEILGKDFEEIAALTRQNAYRAFPKMRP